MIHGQKSSFQPKNCSLFEKEPLSIGERTVQEWLGHESLATTQKYLEPSKKTDKQLEDLKLPF